MNRFGCAALLVVAGLGGLNAQDLSKEESERRNILENRSYAAEPGVVVRAKGRGEVIRSTEKHIEIDKGSLNTVHERDVYEVYDGSGVFKGLAEIKGVGDLRAIGRVYSKKKAAIQTGDQVRFRGQRKFVEMGLLYGSDFQARLGRTYRGGGLAWKWNFQGGWAVDFLWTTFKKGTNETEGEILAVGDTQTRILKDINLSFPVGVRRHFRYPSDISPFLGIGLSLFKAEYQLSVSRQTATGGMGIYSESAKDSGVIPYCMAGIEFFSGRKIHLGVESRYFQLPTLRGLTRAFKEKTVVTCMTIKTTW